MDIGNNGKDITIQYLKFVQGHLTRNRLLIVGIITCIIITTLSSYYLPRVSQLIIDEGFVKKNRSLLISNVMLFFLLTIINSGLFYLQEIMRTKLSAAIKGNMFNDMFVQMLEIDAFYYRGRSFTELYDQTQTDIEMLAGEVGVLLIVVLGGTATIIGGLLGLVSIDIIMTLVIVAFIPIHYCIVSFFSKSRRQMVSSYIDCESKMAGWLDSTIHGINEIRVYGLSSIVHSEFSAKQHELIEKETALSIHESCTSNVTNIISGVITVSVYVIGSYYYFRNVITLGSIVAFLTYTEYVLSPISTLIGIKYSVATVVPSFNRYCDFIGFFREDNGDQNVPMEKSILFSGVTVSYGEVIILKNASFSINSREITALAGVNGSGKSTIINVLLRLLTPQKGTISMAGIDISNIKIKEYRSLFSYIAQTPFIFNDTIKQNICLGRDMSDESIEEAIEDIAGHDFMLEHTLSETAGDGGAFFSCGERQAIAFARAMLQDKDIIVLDEPTSNLDFVRKKAVIKKLQKMKDAGKTVVVATHDDDLINIADSILQIEDGTVHQRKR